MPETSGALTACRALLNLGRSLGDEPGFFPQWRRIEIRIRVCRKLERALAQGQPSEEALATTQETFRGEDAVPLCLLYFRGDRAITHRLLCDVDDGKHRLSEWG